jgi:hypothetical protein
MKGIENSTTLSLIDEIVNGATAKSASYRSNSPTIPFHLPVVALKKKIYYIEKFLLYDLIFFTIY